MQAFLGVGGFLAAVAGVLVPLWVAPEDDGGSSASPPSATAPAPLPATGAPGQSQTSNPAGTSASPTAVVGACLSATDHPLPCDGPHLAEVIGPASDCSESTLVRHLGGLAGVDVLTPDAGVAVTDIGGSSVCIGHRGAGVVLTAHARDALIDGRGDEWRWCIDDRSGRNVSCGEPHTAEVVSDPPSDGEDLDCHRRADAYTATDLSEHVFELSVSPRGPAGAQQCVIAVRNDGSLTASLRDLRSRALPVESG
ncbi:hypothetical protein [Geodermatophilus sp. SYSU D00696]